MFATSLPSTVYNPFPQARREARITLIENEPQTNMPLLRACTKLTTTSLPNDHGATKKATTTTPSSDATSDASSMWSHRSSRTSYDELYDITEDESEEVPLKLSASVKKQAEKEKTRYPSIIIPSPSAWPTVKKLQSACSIGLSPASKIAISPVALATLNARGWHVPSTSSTPSLDGSLTSEELAMSSCPSTPDLEECIAAEGVWDPPVQLHPDAFDTLHHLAPEDDRGELIDKVIEVPREAIQEMQEIVRDSPVRPEFVLLSVEDAQQDINEPLSALSIPSPGGFFSSLAPNAARTWSLSPVEPSTSTAETFYGVPWRPRPGDSVGQGRDADPSGVNRRLPFRRLLTIDDITEVEEITNLRSPIDFSEKYQTELQETAVETFTRTKAWLHAQMTHLATILEEDSVINTGTIQSSTPSTPDPPIASGSTHSSPSGKSVRFVEVEKDSLFPIAEEAAEEPEPLFYHGYQNITKRNRNRDVFVHCQARAEATHAERSGFFDRHCQRVRGNYQITNRYRPAPPRPISTFLTEVSDDALKETIAVAERERQALEQVRPSVWEVQAAKRVFGGELLLSPTLEKTLSFPGKKVLDFGGKTACDWAWQYALENRNVTVYTVPIGCDTPDNDLTGPRNHRVVTTTKPWSLPFPADTFDVVSARSLHTLLKISAPPASPALPSLDYFSEDEYDLTLRELRRVLKPGGYLEFSIYDAALLHPGPLGHALGVEFTFNLRIRGYDPCASKTFLSRLERAGFLEVRRSWLVLPMADVTPRWTDQGRPSNPRSASSSSADSNGSTTTVIHVGGEEEERRTRSYQVPDRSSDTSALYKPPLTGSTKDVKAMTGLVGAGAWEQWMLKLGHEMATPEQKTMEQLSRVLEEGGKTGAGWKCLVGWARK